MGGKWDHWKPWVTSKPLFFHFWTQSITLSKGCLFSNFVPVYQYVYLIISVPVYALSYNVCVLAEYSIKEEDFRCAFPIILRLKRMHFTKSKTNEREKQIKVNLLKTYFGF